MQNRRLPELQQITETAHDRPAIGLVATNDNLGAVSETILRAREHEYRVFVTSRHRDCETLRFARTLGATVLDPPEHASQGEEPKERLAHIARTEGHPGLLYLSDPSQQINYGYGLQELLESERFVVDAPLLSTPVGEAAVVVGLPAYNEASTIGAVVRAAAGYGDEVLVVDDGSDDETVANARAAGATVVEHETNRGYGAALKTLFQQAELRNADHLVVLDSDGQHDANDIPNLVRAQQETDADIVIGSRFADGANTRMPVYRRFGLGVVNLLTNLSLGIVRRSARVGDTQSGFRAYSKRAIESLAEDDAIGDHMNASTDILYHANSNGYVIEEVPTTINYEVENGSSHNPIHHGIVLVMNIVRTIERERPITVLGVPGVACTLLGFGFGYWVFHSYFQSGIFPTEVALFSSLLTIIGILSSFTAIILHSLAVYQQ